MMTLGEFKAWLDGFADAMGDAPNADQWAKIRAKLATVENSPLMGFRPGLPNVQVAAPGAMMPSAVEVSPSIAVVKSR